VTELERILALPTRDLPPDDLAEMMTEHCRRPDTTPPFSLYPEQALALLEAVDSHGLVMAAVVGSGKTLVSFLLATVTGARKPLIIIPAHLRDKTLHEWKEYAQYWNLTPPIVKSYTEISRDKDGEGVSRLLEALAPDCIIVDEAHHIGNLDAGCTRKIRRYLLAHPECRFYAFTGTLLQGSLMDGWHICLHALGQGSPLPLKKAVCEAWSQAVDPTGDEDVREKAAIRAGLHTLPGDLRVTLRERIQSTPGYVTSTAKYTGPLEISRTDCDVPSECEKALADLANGIRPDGQPLDAFERLKVPHPKDSDAATRTMFARWHLAQTLFLGYWDRPDPEPPPAWVLARACWNMHVAEMMGEHGDLDTPEAVQYAVERGRLKGKDLLANWLKARAGYKYKTRAEWLTKRAPALRYAADWIKRHPRGLVWTPSESAGLVICALAGLDPQLYFYGAGQGKTEDSPVIEAHQDRAVVTIGANKSGRNLQHRWSDNLILATPSLSGVHDQILGRTHRPGQKHTVTAEYVRGLPAHDSAWQAALTNAEFVRDITGDTPKLLLNQAGD
jgi:hypothetical protein